MLGSRRFFLFPYFSPVGIVPVVGAGNGSLASAAGTLRRSSAASQSPAHSFVPLTVPTNLQPVGPFGDTCTKDLLPTFGAFGARANALVEQNTAAKIRIHFIGHPIPNVTSPLVAG